MKRLALAVLLLSFFLVTCKEEDAYITPALPKTVVLEENSETFIELVPYGASTIRLTVFSEY